MGDEGFAAGCGNGGPRSKRRSAHFAARSSYTKRRRRSCRALSRFGQPRVGHPLRLLLSCVGVTHNQWLRPARGKLAVHCLNRRESLLLSSEAHERRRRGSLRVEHATIVNLPERSEHLVNVLLDHAALEPFAVDVGRRLSGVVRPASASTSASSSGANPIVLMTSSRRWPVPVLPVIPRRRASIPAAVRRPHLHRLPTHDVSAHVRQRSLHPSRVVETNVAKASAAPGRVVLHHRRALHRPALGEGVVQQLVVHRV
mmetsp:Transcript_10390/g.34175  ORF Transcript_10390/g.34175 Transcript_10390/m.34175 type:complete len:257 (-) Transcript_10390:129-899(-)